MKGEISEKFATIEEGDDEELKSAIDLHTYYQVNDRVLVIVTSLSSVKGVKVIELSMRPSLIYSTINMTSISKSFTEHCLIQGEVLEKEDYGYSIHIGLEIKGFLKCDTTSVSCIILDIDVNNIVKEGGTYLFTIASLSEHIIQLDQLSSHKEKAIKCIHSILIMTYNNY